MPDIAYSLLTKAGDLVQLVGLHHAFHLVRLINGGELQTHRGVIQHNDLIGKPWGSQVFSHTGKPFFILQPSIADVIRNIKRNTQILYPKDIGFILLNMGIGPGSRVIEAGSGSGAFTQALAFSVGDSGHVYSYEIREEMIKLARKNLNEFEFSERVTFYLHDIREGFYEKDVNAIFLDLPNPYDFISQVKSSLIPGGYFGTILPTTNQVIDTLIELQRNSFRFTDVCEILLRYYKVEFERFRPTDRMVSHTGYLIFSRKILIDDNQIYELEDEKE